MTIWKYTLQILGTQDVMMPSGATLLDVQQQAGELTLWALVDSDNDPVRRRIVLRGTGHLFGDAAGEYIGTVQMMGGSLVWHLFDFGEPTDER